MTRQDLADRTHDNVAGHLGQTTIKMIEAQTAAEMMAESSQAQAQQLANHAAFGSQLVASLAARWLGAL